MIVVNRDVNIRGSVKVTSLGEVYKLIEDVSEPVLVVFDGVYGFISDFRRFSNSRGLNWFLLDFVDPIFESRLVKGVVSLEVIIEARLRRLELSNALKAPIRLGLSKVVSRRDVLTRGPIAALEYLVAPIVDSDRCNVLGNCSLCIDRCPFNALSGKPPTVDFDKCVMCGLCISLCPVDALTTPRFTFESIEWYVRILREYSNDPMYVVLTSYNLLRDVYELSKVEYPTLILPFDSIEEIPPITLLKLASRGLTPVIYGSVSEYYRSIVEDLEKIGVLSVVSDISGLEKVLANSPKLHDKGYRETYRGYVRLVLEGYTEELDLKFPGYSELVVDRDYCTLCEACTKACPTGALVTERGEDIVKLTVNYDECIACSECMLQCPEKAIRDVKWRFRRRPKTVVELADSKIARCARCGAPLESEKLILKVEKVLRERGLHHPLEYTRLCPKCKVERMLST